VRLLDQATDVVADDLAKHLTDHGVAALASDMIPKLGFDHREGCLDVAPLVIVRQKFVTAELVVSTF
jgi:hypothetical protein